MRTRLLPGLAVLICVCGSAQTRSIPELDRFRESYTASLARLGIIGSSFAFVHDGKPLVLDFRGAANHEKGQNVDRDTAWHWASITKTFTAIAIMQLRDHGLLRLDDPAVKYVPELRQVHNPYGPIEAITIRQLMTHSAGFRSPTWPWGGDQPWHPFEPPEWAQVAAMLPYTEVLFPPGSRHSYSNLGYVFLGQIIERLTNDDYEVYIDKNILKPLRMYASYFDRAPYFLLAHRAAGYYKSGSEVTAAPFDFDSGITVSNSGLNAPFPDMLNYLGFLLGDPGGNALYDQVLKRNSLEEMFQKQLPLSSTDPSQGIPSPGHDWVGLGFFLHEQNGRLYIGHGGQQGGFISHFYIDPVGRSASLIAFNTDITTGAATTQTLDGELTRVLIDTLFPLWGDHP